MRLHSAREVQQNASDARALFPTHRCFDKTHPMIILPVSLPSMLASIESSLAPMPSRHGKEAFMGTANIGTIRGDTA